MFIDSRRAKRPSPKYVRWLGHLLVHLEREFKTLPTRPEPLEQLMARLQEERSWSAKTQLDVFNVWRMLYRWSEGRLGTVNPMLYIERPIQSKKQRRPALSELQVERLLWVARKRGQRDRTLIELLLDAGPRIGELTSLTFNDVTWEILSDGTTVYTLELPNDGKRGARNIPILPETFRSLQRLAASNDGVTLWTGRRGRLTTSGLQDIVRKCLREIGVDGGPHMLRHTFARIFLRRDGKLPALQEILGHTNIETTAEYLDISGEVRAQHARCSPLAGLAEQ